MNKANKIIYGERMMNNIRKYHLMPEEIFSERNRTADDGALAKILFFDVGRQLRTHRLLHLWMRAIAMIELLTPLPPFPCQV